ncbi:MAG: AAA family ATPase, partial [Limnochordia bacterium]|nr:AAA family ATPase [Limnochordia bacterium]
MKKEILIGTGIAVVIFALVSGVDVTPLIAIGALLFILKYFLDVRGKEYQTVNVAENVGVTPHIGFDDIGGQEVAKREFIEALDFVKDASRCRKLGIRPIKGILLFGPPGTGKTLLAKAAATYTNAAFLAASGSEFVEMYAGVGAKRVRSLFQRARELAKKQTRKSAIIFVDEIEVLGGKRGRHTSHLEYDQTLNQLLVEMDGIRTDDEISLLVVAATNRVDLLDPALMRPGRFDRLVSVELPDKEGRLHILRIHTRGKPLAEGVDLAELAKETFGFSGAHLESLVNEAAINALRQKRNVIAMQDFREAIDKVMMGEKLDRKPAKAEKQRVAIHEVGHALVSELANPGSVSRVTIVPRGRALGYMRQTPTADQYLYTVEELQDQMAVALAGAVAEELILGSRSTGGTNDFEQAVNLAKRMIASGMSELGVIDMKDVPTDILHRTISSLIGQREDWVRKIIASYQG